MFTPTTLACVPCRCMKRICRESYNDPHDVYETLKRRGMDLVTVTDHDSIDAVEPLRTTPIFS